MEIDEDKIDSTVLIEDPINKSKSVWLTDEGLKASEALFNKMFNKMFTK